MLQIPLWKRFMILAVCLAGLLFSFPNFFYSAVEQHNDAVEEITLLGTTPEREAAAASWPGILPSGLVNLGLDLRGGVQLLAEVQVEDVYADRMDGYWLAARDALVTIVDQVGFIERVKTGPDDVLQIRIQNADAMQAAIQTVRA
ncbi:MAG: protein translocase subunit SecD, partial [Pseudomonadota bacterium]